MKIRKKVGLVVVGGGPAGLAAALEAQKQGCEDIVLIERDVQLGGILNQCIHTGFGLHYFGEELSGPEYADRFIRDFLASDIPHLLESHVLEISPERIMTVLSPQGLMEIQAESIVLAMGCRERPRGALGISGTRCAGVLTAGMAQRLLNMQGLMPGKSVVILGSGDIGLIMARRLTLEGAKVQAVVELMSYSSGLTRNVVQCLMDYQIPLKLSHTVIEIHGRERLTGVTIAPVNPLTLEPDLALTTFLACDTLLLSVGLIPENELSLLAGVTLDPATQGPFVDQSFSTDRSGIFACGNVLHVHDLVDDVSREAESAARSAVRFLKNRTMSTGPLLPVVTGTGVRSLVPQHIQMDQITESIRIVFRPARVFRSASVCLRDEQGRLVIHSKRTILTPGEESKLDIPGKLLLGDTSRQWQLSIEVQP